MEATKAMIKVPEGQKQSEAVPGLERLRIDPTAEIGEPPVFCRIGEAPAMTGGSFSMINGKQKSGKTFLLASIVASLISDKRMLNQVQGLLPDGKRKVLYFDTEQSPFHATRTIKRICQLAGDPNPDNLIAFQLRTLSPAERLEAIENKIYSTPGLGAVVIDGIRDLLTLGINDEGEATTLISKFLKWTGELNITMILLLHQNKTDQNARGHVGTEMLNKSETILAVTKDDRTGLFVVSCTDSRDFAFEDFAFSIQDGLPTVSDLPQEERAKNNKPQFIDDDKHFTVLNNIFRQERRQSYPDLIDKIRYGFENNFGQSAARSFITHYLDKGWIKKGQEGNKKFYIYERAIF